jgi:hypothetical protein
MEFLIECFYRGWDQLLRGKTGQFILSRFIIAVDRPGQILGIAVFKGNVGVGPFPDLFGKVEHCGLVDELELVLGYWNGKHLI